MRIPLWCAGALLTILLASGCNEDFSPKVPGGNRYYLFCIVNATPLGGGVHFAVVDRMYDVEGLNPAVNTVDPFVAGTEIVLTVRGQAYVFRRGEMARLDTSRYTTRVHYYSASGMTIVARDAVVIRATLPDGTVLTSSTVVPDFNAAESIPQFANGVTTLVNRYTIGDRWLLVWEGLLSSEEHLFFPRLLLTYTVTDSAGTHSHTEPVPFKYVHYNSQYLPVYPSYQTTPSMEVEFDALDRFMEGIGQGIDDKSGVHVQFLSLVVIECDQALSRYYSSVNGYMDQFSVRLDERTYTNIQGGEGIFGSSTTTRMVFPVNAKYAAHFGYAVE
jgi:hypothetical protein